MIGKTCPRCHGPLPEAVVRAMAAGTTCPFCGEKLKSTPTRALDAAPAADEDYQTLEVASPVPPAVPAAAVGQRPSPAPKPMAVGQRPAAAPAIKSAAPIKSAPASAPAKAAPVATAVKPAAVAAVKPAAAPIKPAPPPAPGMTAAAAPKSFRQTMVGAALAPSQMPFEDTPAPVSLAPPVSTPLTRPPAAPAAAAGRVVAIPSAPVAAAAAARVVPQPEPPPEPAPRALSILDDDSGPTHAVLPSAIASEAVTPLFEGMDSAPIAAVTVMPDPTPMAPGPSALQPAPPRRLAILGVGMGVLVVLVVFLVVKVVGGRKTAVKPVATEVAKAAPEPTAAEPMAAAEPVPTPKAAPAGPSKAALRAAKIAEKRERAAAKLAEKRERAAAKVAETRERAAAKVAETRERASQAKARHTKAPRARKIAMAKTTAKTSAPSAPAARADARPAYERGNAALLAGDGKAAIAAYREAVKSAPSDPIGFRGLGLAYEHEGENAAAIKALRRYLKLAPDAADQAIISRRLDRLSARQTKKK